MPKEIWLNLPVKNVQRSKAFFSSIGFRFNEERSGGNESACMLLGDKNVVIMLFEATMFAGFTKNILTDTQKSSELLISFDAQSREEIDEMAKRVVNAGGTIFAEPAENQGWMYGFAFMDLDGHRWNGLYMDLSKLPR
jgi:uncharacterized protein